MKHVLKMLKTSLDTALALKGGLEADGPKRRGLRQSELAMTLSYYEEVVQQLARAIEILEKVK